MESNIVKVLVAPTTSGKHGVHVDSPAALTLRGYAEAMAAWSGRPARLRFLPWEAWRQTVSEAEAKATWDHITHSPNCSIAKAQRLLGYAPRYTSLQTAQEAVTWLRQAGQVEAGQVEAG